MNSESEIVASNPTDTLVINGVSYHPTKKATTKLSDIPMSDAWKAEH